MPAKLIVKPDGVPTAEGLMSAVRAVKGPPPVHLWNPPFCGDIDMRIARDGAWFYNGTPIGRPAMVKLFASILKREGVIVLEGKRHVIVPNLDRLLEETGDDSDGGMLN